MKGLPELVIGDLKVKRPVIQGGMGVGVSLGQLAGAVAKEGGVGIISTAQIGFREPDFYRNAQEANLVNRILKRIQGRQISVQLDRNFKEQERRLRMA